MISVIICSIDDRRFAAVEATYRRILAGSGFEIIRIGDATSMCQGYNRGLAQSRGETLIFSHDDIEIHADDFLARLQGHLTRAEVVGVAGTTLLCGPAWAWAGPPHVYGQLGQFVRAKQPGASDQFEAAIFSAPARHVGRMQALDGVFLACHRRVAEATPFDEQTFNGWHHYDVDFTYRAFVGGFNLAVGCDLDLIHFSGGAWDQAWKASSEAFLRKHGQTLPRRPPATWVRTSSRVATREQLLPIFRPPHWDERAEQSLGFDGAVG